MCDLIKCGHFIALFVKTVAACFSMAKFFNKFKIIMSRNLLAENLIIENLEIRNLIKRKQNIHTFNICYQLVYPISKILNFKFDFCFASESGNIQRIHSAIYLFW